MTTVDTLDTMGSVEQCIRMIEAGCELIRITAPSIKEAENLANIKSELRKRGFETPLVADIHFTPNAAEVAAKIVEKVRINPGNYADKKKFEVIEYTDSSYQEELDRIRTRFLPLVKICKENGTAMRIGTNHGSLSDRIMSRYGDTPLGMICEDQNYHDIVISMKSSNTQVMVQAYRLLVQKLNEGGFKPYPLHLGVTEAGEAEDGRIKSAVGIGTLLEDAPVAKALIDRYTHRAPHEAISAIKQYPIDPFEYKKRNTYEVYNTGGHNVPQLDKWKMNDQGCDFVYSGANSIPFMLPNGMKEIQNASIWALSPDQVNKFPLFELKEFEQANRFHGELNFLEISDLQIEEAIALVRDRKDTVLILKTSNEHSMPAIRRAFVSLMDAQNQIPVIVKIAYPHQSQDLTTLYAATDVGGLLVDGLGDGIFISLEKDTNHERESILNQIKLHNSITTAMIRKRTDHLKGVKIGIMGCIVNGPGEMADADYGYVGSGKGKITLYKGKEVMKKSVPSEKAVDELINIIKEDGMWIEPEMNL
ncbi:1-hydroxy-2-methyl-2-(E)-butenyl 4-diphosphate synthase [Daphnia sinensis]|uniref:1-hydroxy-2-methyl-2-(E)-butenyl 4-diphosphate synthase n=1 Tax=Daphnia sinensis TaxID=1820382 RepID=A0AAD5KTB2_9CRUS|nr:1-hydroxy-2-methyl-2-(E)-butenyl 4-diphosphate synthase [Daphnia sinensis]